VNEEDFIGILIFPQAIYFYLIGSVTILLALGDRLNNINNYPVLSPE